MLIVSLFHAAANWLGQHAEIRATPATRPTSRTPPTADLEQRQARIARPIR
jgi:hypothetical protein